MKVGDRMGRFLPMGTTSVIVANGAALPPFVRVAFLEPPVQETLTEIEQAEGNALPNVSENLLKRTQ
jgi:hypothetical protein